MSHGGFPPTTGTTHSVTDLIPPRLEFFDTARDGAAGDPRCQRGRRHPTMPLCDRLIGRKQPTAAFVEELDGLLVANSDVIDINHIGENATRLRFAPN